MPTDSGIDWTLARLLRAQRFTFEQIAQKLGCNAGTVRGRANREGWNAAVQKAEEIAIQSATVVCLKDRAEKYVAQMADDVEEQVAIVRKHRKPKTVKGLYEREAALEKLNKRARLTFGLESDAAGGGVNLGLFVQVNAPATDGSKES